MYIPLLNLRRELQEIAPEIRAQWNHVLSHPQFLNGDNVRTFETEMAEFLGVANVVGVSSGTEALILGLAACGIGEGDEVILPANAFVAALEAIWWLRATPVVVDIQNWDLGPDLEQIRQQITRRTKALLVVHLYGTPVYLDPLITLCRKEGIHLIEDCSHAHGAHYDERHVGTSGSVGCFSCGVVKNLAACGEAGFVSTQDVTIAERLRLLRAHGQEKKNEHLCYGTNGRLDEIQAAVLRIKLRSLNERNTRRRTIAQRYSEAFSSLPLGLPWCDSHRMSVYHQYVIRTDHRDALRTYLYERGIETGIHYLVPLHQQPAWQATYRKRLAFPRAEQAALEVLSLPVFPDLTEEEIATVIDSVRSFFLRDPQYQPRPQVSFVVPFYNEVENVLPLSDEIRIVADTLGCSYECLFIDDGSTDQTAALLDGIAAADSQVRVLHLPQNRGEAGALSAGFHHARGRVVMTLDGDGQNDPYDIPALLAKIAEGYPVVSGWRQQRHENYWKRILPSRLANDLIAWVTGVPIHDCGCGLKAYRHEILTSTALPHGMHRFLPVILRVPSEAITEVKVNDRARPTGSSHYGFSRIFAVLRDLLPVRCIRYDASRSLRYIGGALGLACILLLSFATAAFTAKSLGKIIELSIASLGVWYLFLVYRRIDEFMHAQEHSSAPLSQERQ